MKARHAKKVLMALLKTRRLEVPQGHILVLKTDHPVDFELLKRAQEQLKLGGERLPVLCLSQEDDLFVIAPGKEYHVFSKDQRVRLKTTGAYGKVLHDEEHSDRHPGPYSDTEVVFRRVRVEMDSGDILVLSGRDLAVLEPMPPKEGAGHWEDARGVNHGLDSQPGDHWEPDHAG